MLVLLSIENNRLIEVLPGVESEEQLADSIIKIQQETGIETYPVDVQVNFEEMVMAHVSPMLMINEINTIRAENKVKPLNLHTIGQRMHQVIYAVSTAKYWFTDPKCKDIPDFFSAQPTFVEDFLKWYDLQLNLIALGEDDFDDIAVSVFTDFRHWDKQFIHMRNMYHDRQNIINRQIELFGDIEELEAIPEDTVLFKIYKDVLNDDYIIDLPVHSDSSKIEHRICSDITAVALALNEYKDSTAGKFIGTNQNFPIESSYGFPLIPVHGHLCHNMEDNTYNVYSADNDQQEFSWKTFDSKEALIQFILDDNEKRIAKAAEEEMNRQLAEQLNVSESTEDASDELNDIDSDRPSE